MKTFTILQNQFLSKNVNAFYHDEYRRGNWNVQGSVENLICSFKNDITITPDFVMNRNKRILMDILKQDLTSILDSITPNTLTVCVIPRAKKDSEYFAYQKQFKEVVKQAVNTLNGFVDGTNYIQRIENTRTTHRDKAGFGGDGPLPYPGITCRTCSISDDVVNKDILLIDDLYTRSINIDEDALEALLKKGAKSVRFYAVGRTVF